MHTHHLAQVNIATMRAPLNDPIMAEFVALLDQVNQQADISPGFVWRLQTEAGDATEVRAYEDERILFNLSVWESLEDLFAYVYRSQHGVAMRNRRDWFLPSDKSPLALWWIPAGELPTVAEAKARLEHLHEFGSTPQAFSFQQPFPAPVPQLK